MVGANHPVQNHVWHRQFSNWAMISKHCGRICKAKHRHTTNLGDVSPENWISF